MTVPEIMANVLDKIRRDFYCVAADVSPLQINAGIRAFMRDQRPLMRAIATYGYECNQRGWHLEADFIYQDLMTLLLDIRQKEAPIQYLPIYLEGAIKRHLGQRAEELSAKAKAMDGRCTRVLSQLPPAAPEPQGEGGSRQPTAIEVLDQMFRGIKHIQRARKATRSSGRESAQTKQGELL